MIVLRLLHLIFGVIWVGAGFYYNFVLLPSLQRMDARTHRSVNKAVTQIMGPLLGISAMITIASGGVMLVQLRHEPGHDLLASGWGLAMIVGTITSILGLVLVLAVEVPAGRKVDRLAASEEREPSEQERRELRQLTDRVVRVGRLATVLLFIALASMAIARYV